MTNDKLSENNEKVMQEALRLLDEGASEASILEAYPAHAADLRALFGSIEQLKAAQSVRPSPEFLRATLSKIATPIPSTLNRRSFPMWKVGVSVLGVLVIAFGGTAIVGLGLNPSTDSGQSSQTVAMDSDSDAALSEDAATIDDQIGALGTDEAQADQALDHTAALPQDAQ